MNLLPPEAQYNLMAKDQPQMPLGDALMRQREQRPNPPLFHQNYMDESMAHQDMKTVEQNVHQLSTPPLTCEVFPPLLVRYRGDTNVYVPVEIAVGGELHKTLRVPDLILNFHAQSQAITPTWCDLKLKESKLYLMVNDALYRMRAPQPLTILEFQELYDQTRMALIRTQK